MKDAVLKYFNDKKNRKTYAVVIVMIILIMVVLIPFSLATQTVVNSVEITSEKLSYNEKKSGSFKVTKSAKWLSKGKAEITIDVDTVIKTNTKYTDIILVLDISKSMKGEKLDRVKSNCVQLVNSILSNSNNKVSLITFNRTSEIVSDFTNDLEELVNKINSLEAEDTTNYYQALVNVDNVLQNYQEEQDRQVITLFLTDGYPIDDVPNEENQYKYLKEKYPYMTINGIQYEMGNTILDPIKKVSDNQFVANIKTLNNVLFEASVAPILYDNFNITDYINNEYFVINNIDDIKVNTGEVTLTANNSKISWSIDEFQSGSHAQMTIKVNLKDEYLNKGYIYPTNTKIEIKSSIDSTKEDISSNLTPILGDNYQVIYEANAPDGCVVENIPSSKNYSVFDTVSISNAKPTCTGYKFKGWSIVTENVSSVNDEYFIMPEKNVVIRAEWSKISVEKSMNGKVYTNPIIYKMMAQNAVADNTSSEFVSSSTGINFANVPSNTNGKGIYELSSSKDDPYPIYYYRGAVTNNNVKFANFCWKIVRTTSTGGVKLIYNGIPDSNGACNNTATSSQIGNAAFNYNYTSPADVGYMYGTRYTSSKKTMNNSYNFVYGNDITYENGVYTLKDTMTSSGWSSDYKKIATKYHYTCFSTGTTCSSVYYIHYFARAYEVYYLTLNDGKNIEDAKNEMFRNTNNSNIKSKIDTWYQNNMVQYTNYLEDTIWCNDRSIYNGPLKGKDENSSSNTYSYFGARGRNVVTHKPSVTCPNTNDSFTVDSNNGNGSLTYPIGLLTADEITLVGPVWTKSSSSAYLYTGQYWWTMTPSGFSYNYAFQFEIHSYMYDSGNASSTYGIRPSISLKPGTKASDGDGTAQSPYIVGE